MKKITKLFLFMFILGLFFVSCKSRFNPRYYYNKSLVDNSIDDNPDDFDPDDFNPDDLDPDGDSEIPIWDGYSDIPTWGEGSTSGDGGSSGSTGTTTVYLDPFKYGEWNDANYRFSMNFDNMLIRATFDGNNRPTYKLVNGTWNFKNSSLNTYGYDGPNTSGSGQSISSVQYWLYKGKNPLFKDTSKYNKSEKIERFYFYRFNGMALGLVYTDNFLVAIDKYSKLVFAYAVPVEWKQYIAGTPKAPVSWGSVDAGWEADYNGGGKVTFKVSGASYFYEYDPIGIVKPNGEIEIYQWCLDSIGNNKRYGPRIDGGKYLDTSRPIATYGQAGRSPYIPIKTNISSGNGSGDGSAGDSSGGGDINDDFIYDGETTTDIITITAKVLKSINARTWHFNGGGLFWDIIKSSGFFHYKICGKVYDADFSNELDYLASMADLPTIPSHSSLLELAFGEQITMNKSQSYEIDNIRDKDVYIDLAADIAKYNLNMSFIDTAGFGYNSSGWAASKGTQKVKLKYDHDKKAFVFKIYETEDAGDSDMIVLDKNFTLQRGEKKDFTIRYQWSGATGETEKIELTYTLEFKSAS